MQNQRYELGRSKLPQSNLFQLGGSQGYGAGRCPIFPKQAFLRCETSMTRINFFTVLRNSAHSNVAHLFDEADRRLPDEDTVTLVTGFIGAYPNAFYLVKTADLSAFVDTVKDLELRE